MNRMKRNIDYNMTIVKIYKYMIEYQKKKILKVNVVQMYHIYMIILHKVVHYFLQINRK